MIMDEITANIDLDIMNLIQANENPDNNYLYVRYNRNDKKGFVNTSIEPDMLLNALGSVLCVENNEEFSEQYADAVLELAVYILSKKTSEVKDKFILACECFVK